MSVTPAQLDAALVDLRDGMCAWRLSGLLAWQDVKQRYRRSTLGPIWLTLSFGIQMITMSVLSSFLFNAPIHRSTPFVCAGMLFWQMITQMINEGSTLFLSSQSYLFQIKRPLTIFVVQVIWRNIIVAAHNAITYVLVAIVFLVAPSPSIILWPIAFVLVLVSVSWIVLVSAIVSARYRDVPVIIQNILTILFWFTPLMYFPEQLGDKSYILDYNPFTYMLAILREPLLGNVPTLKDWLVVIAFTVVGWIGTVFFFARFRARIVYWL
jgi:ABC-type polysaccharide/polyol phosphate export permease